MSSTFPTVIGAYFSYRKEINSSRTEQQQFTVQNRQASVQREYDFIAAARAQIQQEYERMVASMREDIERHQAEKNELQQQLIEMQNENIRLMQLVGAYEASSEG